MTFIFPYGIVIPIDELIFFRGIGQPPTRSSLVEAANGFVDEAVKKELEDWAQADTNVTGWRELISRHLQMANRLRSLDNDQAGMG